MAVPAHDERDYEFAKKFGIVTGEPIYFAKKKCNNLQVLHVNVELTLFKID